MRSVPSAGIAGRMSTTVMRCHTASVWCWWGRDDDNDCGSEMRVVRVPGNVLGQLGVWPRVGDVHVVLRAERRARLDIGRPGLRQSSYLPGLCRVTATERRPDLRNEIEFQLGRDIRALGRRMVDLDRDVRHALEACSYDTAAELSIQRLEAQAHRSSLMQEAFAWRRRDRWS